MTEDQLALRFEEHRPHLLALAARLLGSTAEAEDAVQDAWLRLTRAGQEEIANLGGWLTTVVSRLCLDRLRARIAHREGALTDDVTDAGSADPEAEAALADAVGAALLVVLDTLRPSERVAFVLHYVFAVSFEEIGRILGRSPGAAKQLASRARRRVRGAAETAPQRHESTEQRRVVEAFLAASREGRLAELVALLDPGVVFEADASAIAMGAPDRVCGSDAVARIFSGRALEAVPASIDGVPGIAWAPGGALRVLWELTVEDGRVTRIDMAADAATLTETEVELDA